MLEIICPPECSERLDRALSRLITGLSRTQARRLIAAGSVFVNGRRCRVASRLVRGGSRLRVEEAPPKAVSRLVILYEDDACVAVDKPPGMPSAPTQRAAAGTALEELGQQLDARDRKKGRLWVVHRLDSGTSGVLLFAKSAEAAARLSASFHGQEVVKVYVAWVTGAMPDEEGRIATPIRQAGRRAVAAPDGRPAVTEWRVLHRRASETLVEVCPRTGRMHQVRVHLSAVGHPVIGDRQYGRPPAGRLMLHAAALRIPHPLTGEPLEVRAPLPVEFETP